MLTGLFIFYIICGVICGIGFSFWYISEMALKSNNLGNYKGDRFDYIWEWTILQEQDGVSRHFNIDYTTKDWEADRYFTGEKDVWHP